MQRTNETTRIDDDGEDGRRHEEELFKTRAGVRRRGEKTLCDP
jgi:hypothetical protein